MNNIKLFETFRNYGVGECVLLAKKGDKFLAGIKEKAKHEFCHYVVASCLVEDGSWCWGHYFSNLAEASNYLYNIPILDYKKLAEALVGYGEWGDENFEEKDDILYELQQAFKYKTEILFEIYENGENKEIVTQLINNNLYELGDITNFLKELTKQLTNNK